MQSASIDQLVAKLSSNDVWMSGYFTPVDLPQTASAGDVVERVFLDRRSLSRWLPTVTTYHIVSVQQVYIASIIGEKNFAAVVVDTNLGQKIVLLQYIAGMKSWWSRIYDAAQSA